MQIKCPQHFQVSGIFHMALEAEDDREAKRKAEQILRDNGIDGCALSVEEKRLNDYTEAEKNEMYN